MSNENNKGSDSDSALIEVFQENDKVLVDLVTRIKNIYANTLVIEKQIKIDALRREIVNEDIRCQLVKINMLQGMIDELES